ncbi:hypothetical protein [Yeosuana marina]|uniref:hypothetical protein n=1 Tax=Yeosuana marina TaxID=1565536 RepID=UPI0030ED7327|tara:strand:+ start:1613 stop:1939 length:327 start_codon:yes stop_codon:yes gene_type:complete
MVFDFVLDNATSGGGSGSVGTEIAFDNSKLDVGDLEGNGNLRLELYNDYGSTAADPGLNKSDLTFSSSIEVTFTLGGITLNTGVVVFVIDVVGMATDISNVTATIDSI